METSRIAMETSRTIMDNSRTAMDNSRIAMDTNNNNMDNREITSNNRFQFHCLCYQPILNSLVLSFWDHPDQKKILISNSKKQ